MYSIAEFRSGQGFYRERCCFELSLTIAYEEITDKKSIA